MLKINKIDAYEILASGGLPTIEVAVTLDDGSKGIASVPYGASAGSHEAVVLVDGDNTKWLGNGMQQAIKNVRERIASNVSELNVEKIMTLDERLKELDGTENYGELGGNAVLAVSMATAKAVAMSQNLPLYRYLVEVFEIGNEPIDLPQPMVVTIEGGKHAVNSTDFQEYLLCSGESHSVKENLRKILETYHVLGKILQKDGFAPNVGNEGAFAPAGIKDNVVPFDYIRRAIGEAGYELDKDLRLGMDVAASEFYREGYYCLEVEDKRLDKSEMMEYYRQLQQQYPVYLIEDPFSEDDWDAWTEFRGSIRSNEVEIIGDDLTVTNMSRLAMAIDRRAVSGLIIKPNQIGTVTETVNCALMAREHDLLTITSHRGGGETNDTAMVDIAVAVGSKFIKVGPTRGERVAKYNRLMEIERELAEG